MKSKQTKKTVTSLRLTQKQVHYISQWAKAQNKDNADSARELLEFGYQHVLLKQYREGKISLGRLSKDLGLCYIDAMDLVVSNGIESKIDYDDHLQGLNNLRKLDL